MNTKRQDNRDAIFQMLKANAPAARIERLRRHPQLRGRADELAAWYAELGNKTNRGLESGLAGAELIAERLDAAPMLQVGKRAVTQRRKAGITSGEERAAQRKPEWDRWQAALDAIRKANPHLKKSPAQARVAEKFGVSRTSIDKRTIWK